MNDVVEALFHDLSGERRFGATTADPLGMDDGILGDLYTTSAVFWSTGEARWLEVAQRRLDGLLAIIASSPVNRDGLLGGYAGLSYLLRAMDGMLVVSEGFRDALEGRIRTYSTVTMGRVFTDGRITRARCGYASSLAGIAHLHLQDGRPDEGMRMIADFLSHLGQRPFPGAFWSDRSDLGEAAILGAPQLSFGGRDLGFHSGLSGIVSVLLEGSVVLGDQRYRSVAEKLLGQLLEDVAAHGGSGMSQYEPPPFLEEERRGPVAASTWRSGVPGLELAVSWNRELQQDVRGALLYGDEYFVPSCGGFDRPGLMDGVAGRLYLADTIGLPSSPVWMPYLEAAMGRYGRNVGSRGTSAGSDGPGPGFLTGMGGVVAVWLGHRSPAGCGVGRGHSPVLSVLGTERAPGLVPGV